MISAAFRIGYLRNSFFILCDCLADLLKSVHHKRIKLQFYCIGCWFFRDFVDLLLDSFGKVLYQMYQFRCKILSLLQFWFVLVY